MSVTNWMTLVMSAFALGVIAGTIIGQRIQIRSCERQGHNGIGGDKP